MFRFRVLARMTPASIYPDFRSSFKITVYELRERPASDVCYLCGDSPLAAFATHGERLDGAAILLVVQEHVMKFLSVILDSATLPMCPSLRMSPSTAFLAWRSVDASTVW